MVIDVPVTVEPEGLGKDTYFVNCPKCAPAQARLEPISQSWDLGWRCCDCGLVFKAVYTRIN